MDALLSTLAQAYSSLGIETAANEGVLWSLLSVVFLITAAGSMAFRGGGKSEKLEAPPKSTVETPKVVVKEEISEAVKEEVKKPTVVEAGPSWSERLSKGLSRSRSEVWGKIGALFGGGKLNDETLEEVEELLYGADIGPAMVGELIKQLQEQAGSGNFTEAQFKNFLFNFLRSKLETVQERISPEIYEFDATTHKGTKVIMVVGVNGAGKTTTIGKLATKLTRQGAKVVVGACDTFRAAAVDQLQVWCERAGAQMIRAKEGASPSGVGYEALQAALNSGADYCILDTAGRLHTASNLMDELKKSKEVLRKLDPEAPEHTLLVLDAITGQNALRQAEEFNKTLALTGLIFTKCDGSSKAGSAIGIVEKLGVPMAYIGVGESVEDLNVFNLDDYLNALLDRAPQESSVTLH